MNKFDNIWVYVDLRNQKYFDLSMKVLAAARGMARSLSCRSVAVITGPVENTIEQCTEIEGALPGVPIEDASRMCVSKGADEVFIIEVPGLISFRADCEASAISRLIITESPRAVLFALTDFGRELAALCAGTNNSGLIADCVELNIEEGLIVAGCPSWGGEIMARLSFADPSATGFLTVQPHAFEECDIQGNPGSIKKIRIDNISMPGKLKRLSRETEHQDHRHLEDAGTVVVGGAGLVNVEGFGLARQLSAALGGELGATRPPVLKHWVDDERLIGQTGKTVRPELLVTVGTSGAVQYTAGIAESKRVVAINRDPNARIFDVADIGIVADARSILPQITDRVKKIVMRDLADVLSGGGDTGTENNFGDKIRKLREAHEWSLEELAQKTDQSPEFIEQVEDNDVVPSVSFLLKLSRALNIDPGTFLRDEEKAAIEDRRAQAFMKRTRNYAYKTLTPGAESQHLRAFMITIEPRQDHKPVAYKHEGEEFVYVMKGGLELTTGSRVHHLKTGESIHYNSETPHKLKNMGDEVTECLVVLYTP